jgi:hypothetical protein
MNHGWIVGAAALAAVAACSKNKGGAGDDCGAFVEKSRPVLTKIGETRGKPVPAKAFDEMLADCRSGKSKGKDQGMFDCVIAAADETAVEFCWKEGFADYASGAKAATGGGGGGGPGEKVAELAMNKLGKALKVHYVTNATFPVGKAGPTPECCTLPNARCEPDPAVWTGIWADLDYAIEEKHSMQLAYEGTATAFTATATLDADCDQNTFVVTLTGNAASGDPVVEVATTGAD